MGRLALVLGSSSLGRRGSELAAVAAKHGAVALQRHGAEGYRLPHQIDHTANLRSLLEAGCDRVLAIGSVGSLRPELEVGEFVCPHDFIALHLGVSAFEDARAHRMPGFDSEWRSRVLAAWREVGPLREQGVYWQSVGPRFETAAEIGLIAAHADVIGMTIAAESIVAGELGLPYAAVCVVDNLANGLGDEELSIEQVEAHREENAARLREALGGVLPRLA